MLLHSWQQRIIATASKFPPRSASIGLLVLFMLNLTSACGLAQTPEIRINPERPARGSQQEKPGEGRINRQRQWRENQEESSTGNMQGSITYQGRVRTYILHTPRTYNPNRSLPLVLVFHGGYGRGRTVQRQSGFNDLADREGFVVAYPDGIDKHWNDGRLQTTNPDVDDVGFVSALIDRLATTKNIDRSRVYATGISNGGAFTNKLACELSDKIAAFAPVASSLSVVLASSCKPSKAISIMMFNSPEDPFVPWQGGVGRGAGGVKLSVPQTVDWWKKHNGCSSQADKKALPVTDYKDSTRVTMSSYSGCRDGSEVIFYSIEGGGHTWPGGADPMPERVSGKITHQLSASETMWEFFKRHTLK